MPKPLKKDKGCCNHSFRLQHSWLIPSRSLGKPDSQQPAILPASHLTVRPPSPWRSADKATQLLPLPLLAGSLVYRRGAHIRISFFRGLGGWCDAMFPISNWFPHYFRPTVIIKTFFSDTLYLKRFVSTPSAGGNGRLNLIRRIKFNLMDFPRIIAQNVLVEVSFEYMFYVKVES